MTKTNTKQEIAQKPVQPTLKKMELFDKETFPIEKMKTVRATTTYFKAAFGLEFRTKQLNKERLIEVVRIA